MLRGHTGGVENRLHWVLDGVFREDESRIRNASTLIIMKGLRQMANHPLRGVKSRLSIKARRFQAAVDDEFREKMGF